MITVVHSIQEAVQRYSRSTSREDEEALVATCNKLLVSLGDAQRQYQTTALLQLGVNQCYTLLISTLDQAYSSAIAPHLLGYLYDTAQRFQDIYETYIQPKRKLSLLEQQYIQQTIQSQFDQIRAPLASKNIPLIYIEEVQSALDSLFQPGKLPELHFYHRAYLPAWMQALQYIARAEEKKDWTTRFIVLLIRYNFNYPGFFNRWREQLDTVMQQLGSQEKTLTYLDEIKDILRRSQHQSDRCFDISRSTLLADMQDHIDESIRKANTADQETSLAHDAAFLLTTLNANELNLFFHYFYHHKLLDYPSKREAAKAFSRSLQSKTGKNISYKTLEKFDKDNLEDTANKILRLLKTVCSGIEKDFRS